jgi:hypothetical protein
MEWNPSKLRFGRFENTLRWLDIERAYQFVEKYAPYKISGDINIFLREIFRCRLNAAVLDSVDSLPCFQKSSLENTSPSTDFHYDFSSLWDVYMIEAEIAKLFYAPDADKRFLELVNNYPEHKLEKNSGRLFGYGTDAYGTYIPLHLVWPNQRDFWGIYISEWMIVDLAIRIFRHLNIQHNLEELPVKKLLDIAYQVILRHELFHFKIEQWSLMLELITGRPYYLPYLEQVYVPTLLDPEDKNLEEALANASILYSKKIMELAGRILKYPVLKAIKSTFLRYQGPGYRNYSLLYGTPDFIEKKYRDVVNYLCNQIVRSEIEPTQPLGPYYMYPPNNNFLRAENLVPIRVVRQIPPEASVLAIVR